jgi:predicted secreted protein
MNWFTGVLVFCMIWMVVLLTVLPWGVRPAEEPEAGHEPGAPERPMLWRKVLATTVISAVIWAVVYVVIDQGWISFRDTVEPFRPPPSAGSGS